MSSNNLGRTAIFGLAFSALLAPPLISLVASPLASADPVTATAVGTGDLTYTLGPDTLTIDPATGGWDSYVQLSNFNFDVSMPADGTYGAVATGTVGHQPFQVGVQDTDGVLSSEFTTHPVDFINPDWGLGVLEGESSNDASSADVIGGDIVTYTLGPDTLSINTATDGFDSYIATSKFDLDVGAPQSDIHEILFTDPGVIQLGVDDDAGQLSYIFSLNPAEFAPPDPCITELGGAVSTDALGGLFGL
jgi:hypothetical protein